MYRIGMLICILFLFQGSRDKLCYAQSLMHECFPICSAIHCSTWHHLLVWYFIRRKGKWFWRIKFKVSLIFFDISHWIAPCQVSMNHCAYGIEFSSGSSKQINSLPTSFKVLNFCVFSKLAVPVQHFKLRQYTINTC